MLSRRFDRFAALCALVTAVSSAWVLADTGILPQALRALIPSSPIPVPLITKAIVLPFALAALCLRLRGVDAVVGWMVAASACVAQFVAALAWSALTWFPDELYALDYARPADAIDESNPWVEQAIMAPSYSEMLVGPTAIFVLSLLAWRAGARLRWLWPLGAACGPAAVVAATTMLMERSWPSMEWSWPDAVWRIVLLVDGGLIPAWYVALAVIVLRTPRAVPTGAVDAGPTGVPMASA